MIFATPGWKPSGSTRPGKGALRLVASHRTQLSDEVQAVVTWLKALSYGDCETMDKISAQLVRFAKKFKISPASLQARFNKETGYTVHKYFLHLRINEARDRLKTTTDSITVIAHDLGFASSQYFSTVFMRLRGITPTAYRRANTV